MSAFSLLSQRSFFQLQVHEPFRWTGASHKIACHQCHQRAVATVAHQAQQRPDITTLVVQQIGFAERLKTEKKGCAGSGTPLF